MPLNLVNGLISNAGTLNIKVKLVDTDTLIDKFIGVFEYVILM